MKLKEKVYIDCKNALGFDIAQDILRSHGVVSPSDKITAGNRRVLFLNPSDSKDYPAYITWDSCISYAAFDSDAKRASLLEVLIDLKTSTRTITITIDGKDIELSEESFQALKEQLTGGE